MRRRATKTLPISVASSPERHQDVLMLKAKKKSCLPWAGTKDSHFIRPNLSAASWTNPWINLSSLWRADWDTPIHSLHDNKWTFFGKSSPLAEMSQGRCSLLLSEGLCCALRSPRLLQTTRSSSKFLRNSLPCRSFSSCVPFANTWSPLFSLI